MRETSNTEHAKAHEIAQRVAKDPLNISDPHTYRRTYWHLRQGVMEPKDFEKQ